MTADASFAETTNRPVQDSIEQMIAASERLIFYVNSSPTSFAEMIGLPNTQLDPSYWLP